MGFAEVLSQRRYGGGAASKSGVCAPTASGLDAALQRLSRFAALRQTGERLGSGLPFGVRRQSREAAPTPLSIAPVRNILPRFQPKRCRRPCGTLPPHSKGCRVFGALRSFSVSLDSGLPFGTPQQFHSRAGVFRRSALLATARTILCKTIPTAAPPRDSLRIHATPGQVG